MKKFVKRFLIILLALLIIFTAFDIALVYFIPVESVIPSSLGGMKGNKLNILLMGTDESGLRTDSMMVASFNNANGTLSFISIPRDIKVTYPKGTTNKLNAVYGISGEKPDETIKFIEGFTGLKINYYAVTKPQGFRELIDSLGGVKFDVPVDMKYSDPAQDLYIDLKKGKQLLNGDKAEQLTRFRGYPSADLGRVSVQRDFLKAVLTQKVNPVNILRAGELFARFKMSVNTNIKAADGMAFLKLLQTMEKDSIKTIEAVTKPQSIGGGSYLACDEKKTRELISKH